MGRKEIGEEKEERKKGEREVTTCCFSEGKNQKLHILLLLTYHWPELRHVATPSYWETRNIVFGWVAIYPA